MKKNIKTNISVILCFITVFLSAVGVSAQKQIVLKDFWLPFDVWQGEGDVSVVVNGYSEQVNALLSLDDFDKLTYMDNEVDEKDYELTTDGEFVKITLKEEYLRSFEDGTYYFYAEFEGVDIGLTLFVVTKKVTVKDYVLDKTWDGKDGVSFSISGLDVPLASSLLEYVSYNGNKLDAKDYTSNFLGSSGFVSISKSFVEKLPAGKHFFDVEFLSITGIKLVIIIPDYYCKGDADGNGIVTAADARLVLRAAAKLENLVPEAIECCDINNDNKINSADARRILRFSAKLEIF